MRVVLMTDSVVHSCKTPTTNDGRNAGIGVSADAGDDSEVCPWLRISNLDLIAYSVHLLLLYP
jgi:hypothetical protein